MLAVVLMLAAVTGSSTQAAAPRGIGVNIPIDDIRAWTLTVVNLTDYPLSLVTNSVVASTGQRPPFNGETAFPLPPYRNVTWQSNTPSLIHQHPYWNGTLTFLPQGMDQKWTVTLNFQSVEDWPEKPYNTTWVYLTADFNANPGWVDAQHGISCTYPNSYDSQYNVMTLSGTDLVVSLYAPYIDYSYLFSAFPDVDVTLVFRRRWPHTPYKDGYQDSLVAPCLDFQDYNDDRL